LRRGGRAARSVVPRRRAGRRVAVHGVPQGGLRHRGGDRVHEGRQHGGPWRRRRGVHGTSPVGRRDRREASERRRAARPRVPRGDPDAGQHLTPEHRAAASLLYQRPGGERAGVRVHGRRQPRRGAPRQGRRVPGVGPAVPDRAGGGARALLPAPRLQPDDRAPGRQVQQHPPRRRPGGPRGGLRAGQVPPLRRRRRRSQRRRVRVHVRRRRVLRLHRA
ncbi:hypothetical protein CFC21_006180, partial [Triticum aestivum]